MINKLRYRVITYTIISVALVLFILMAIINAANYIDKDRHADAVLSYLAENDGEFPMHGGHGPKGMEQGNTENNTNNQGEFNKADKKDKRGFGDMTEETPFETRFFSVTLKEDGTVKSINTGKIAAVSSSEAVTMAGNAAASGKSTGYDGNYKFLVHDLEGETQYIFLDCTKDLGAVKSFLKISLLISALGLIAISVLVVLLSPRMIKPIAESYAKQKEFITNAGHELKTPMAVIGSCTEVIEMQSGENKWTAGIKEQVKRLTDLTNHMVALAKMDEGTNDLPMEDLNFSKLVDDALEGFSLEAEHKKRPFEKNIEEGINIKGNKTLLNELISILADNALKYATGDEPIKFSLSKRGNKVQLVEENSADGLSAGSQNRLFDRFYRDDASHSSETPGSGIGLSMAQSIVEAHGGTITAESPDGERLIITATL